MPTIADHQTDPPTDSPTPPPRHRRRRWRAFATLAALVAGTVVEAIPPVAAGTAAAASSCSIVWDGGAGTAAWIDAANWTGDRLPTWSDDACISSQSAPTNGIVVDGASNQIVNSLSADIDLRVAMDPAAGLRMVAGSYLHDLYVDSGYVEADTSLDTWSVVHTGGDIGGPGAITVNGEYDWSGGRMYGTGWTELKGTQQVFGLYVQGGGDHGIDRRLVVADYGVRWEDGSKLHLTNGGTLRTFNQSIVEAPGALIDGAGFVDNRGAISVQADADVDIDAQYLAVDAAWLDIATGSAVRLGADTSIDGDVVVEPGAGFDVDADADVQFSALSEIRGAGEVSTSHDLATLTSKGNVDVGAMTTNAGTIQLDGTTSIDSLEIDAGAVMAGTGRTVTAGDLAIYDGAAFGAFHVTGSAELAGGKVASDGTATFRVDGTATIDGPFRSEDTALSFAALEIVPSDEPGVVPGLVLAGHGAHVTVDGIATTTVDATIDAGTVGGRETDAAFQAHDLQIASGVLTVKVPMTVGPDDSVTITDGAQLTVAQLDHRGAMSVAGTILLTGITEITGDITTEGEAGVIVDQDAVVTLHDGAAVGGTAAYVENDGSVRGQGTLLGDVTNAGDIAPEPTIDVVGTYTQDPDTGRLLIDVNGDHISSLNVTGDAALGGDALLYPEQGGEAPRGEQSFLTATGGITGTLHVGGDLEGCGDVRYDAHAVVLVAQPCIVVAAASGQEGDEHVDFLVSLSTPATSPVQIHYGIVPGTADITDYVDAPGTVTIPTGATSGTISIGIVDDDDEEQDETFTLALDATGGELQMAEATGTIVDDDTKLDLDYQSIPTISGIQYITGLGTEYVVGVSSPDADTDISWVYRITTDEFGRTQRGFTPSNLNDLDQAVGDCAEGPCVRHHGVDILLDTGGARGVHPTAISNDGEVVGYRYSGAGLDKTAVRWASPTSPMEDIAGLPGDSVEARDVNIGGTIVGTTRQGNEEHAWVRTPDGVVTDLGFFAGMADASIGGIAEDGTVAGGMTPPFDPTNPWEINFHGFTWTAEGGLVDLGPETWVWDVNSDGDMVGMIGARAALWRGDRVIDINKAMGFGADTAGVTLVEARKINDRGSIVVVGSAQGYETHGVLVPPGGACRVCLDAHLYEPEFPQPDHLIDAGDEIVEGNPAELFATIRNNDSAARTVTVDFIGPDGQKMTETRTLTLAPDASLDSYVPWETEGLAWKDGVDAGPVDLKIEMRDVSGALLASFPFHVRVVPRPIVNVHGMNSDASTWASYAAFAANTHDGWKAFAVDTMNTKPWLPNTIAQNAALLDTYVQKVQREQNAWQVDLVAHSMGGLISRYWIQNLMEEHDGVRAARQLVMLGTPNLGSPCADLFTIPMTAELRTDVMSAFNRTITDHHGVPFSLAAGNTVPTTCGLPYEGDIVVPMYSAVVGVEDVEIFPVLHTDMTASGLLFTNFVLPRLDGQHPVAAIASPTLMTAGIRAVEAAAAPAPATPTESAPVLQRSRDAVAPGETVSVPVQVPAGLTTIGVTVAGSPSLEIAIVKAGTVLATTGTDPAFGADFRTITLAAPAAGSYTVRLINHGTTTVDASASVWAEGDTTKLVASATQIGINGTVEVQAHLEGDTPPSPVTRLYAEIVSRSTETIGGMIYDDGKNGDAVAGDGVFTGRFPGIPTGPLVVDVRTDTPGFVRIVSTGLVLSVGEDGPGNDAPVALPTSVTVPTGEVSRVDVQAADPEGDTLTYDIVTAPAHGQLGGEGPYFQYLPTKGYQGADSFSFRVFDGQLWSRTVTVTITVDRARAEIIYRQPLPAKVTTNASMHVVVTVQGLSFEHVDGGTVTMTLGSRTVTAPLSNGGAEADLLADLPGGRYQMSIAFSGNAKYTPATTTQMVDVFEGVAPVPRLEPITGEAGYTVRFWGNAGDNDGDAIRYQLDFEDDGVFDAEVGPVGVAAAVVDHVFDVPFTGTARLRVTDGSGHVVETTAPITIAPHRELGALRRILVDGQPVQPVDISEGGRYLLYQVVDIEDGHSLPTPYGVMDLQTGEHELVTILPDGSAVQFPSRAVMSPDGRSVAFTGEDWVNGFLSPQTYVRNLDTHTTVRASMNRTGGKTATGTYPIEISDGGTKVIFTSISEDIVDVDIRDCGTVGSAERPCEQVYLRDLEAGTTTLISRPEAGLAASIEPWPGMSPNGRWVAYTSRQAIWLVDTVAGTWTHLPVGIDGADGNRYGTGEQLTVSDDGRFVTFTSESTNLSPADQGYSPDVYRYDTQTHTTSVVSLTLGGTAAEQSQGATMDRCGARTVFGSFAGTIVAGDTNEAWDVFLRDTDGSIRRLSLEARDGIQGDDDSDIHPIISPDGRWVTFYSAATNLVPGDVEGYRDAFVLDLGSSSCGGTQPRVNHAPTASPVTVTTDEDTAVAVALVGEDADGDDITFAVVDGPVHGSLSGSGAALTYTPVANWSGTDSFTYTVSDGALTSDVATVTITVRPVNDAPTASITGPVTLAEGTTGALTVSAVDVDGDALTYGWTTSGGSILPNGTGTGATLNAGDGPATRHVTVTVSDGTASAVVATDVAITNVAPTVTITAPTTDPSTTTGAAVAFTATVSDSGGDTVTCSIAWGDSSAATAGCSGSHSWTTAGTYTVRVTATDDDGASSSATRTVTVTPTTWAWQGFFAPIDNLPAVNLIEPGSTVPVKFSIGGDRGTAIFAAGYPATYSHPCSGSGPSGALQPIDPSSLKLTYDARTRRYQFNWKTTASMAGTCRTLVVQLADGSVHTAEFRFRNNGGGGCGGGGGAHW